MIPEKAIRDLLRRHKVMAIATIRPDGYPQTTQVTYAYEGLTLYFACDKTAQKVRNIRRSPKVSIAIGRDDLDWSKIRGLSMGANATILRGRRAVQHALGLLQERFPQWAEISLEELSTLAFVKVEPVVISLLDYSKGFGHTELFKLEAARQVAASSTGRRTTV